MGIKSDFIVATPEDALQYQSLFLEGRPLGRFEWVAYKRFTNLSLELLWSILRGERWRVERHRLEHVYHTGEGESWMFRFPGDFVHLLSALEEKNINQVADEWVDREVPGNSDELKPVLRDLNRLAVIAQKSGRGLFLWGSL